SPTPKYLKALTTLTGTASDNFNVAKVEFRFLKEIGAGGNWWHNGQQSNPGFDAANTENDSWQVADGSSPAATPYVWSSTAIPAFAGNPGRYKVNTRAFDSAGNTLVYSTASFVLDDVPPISKSSSIVNNGVIRGLTGIYGTASDGNGVQNVFIKLERKSDAKCWNWQTPGTFGTDCSFFAPTALSGSIPNFTWVQNADMPQPDNTVNGLQTGATYYVTTLAKDAALNFETALTTITFIFDNTPPTIAVTTPAASGYYTSAAATGGKLLSAMNGPVTDSPSGPAPNIDNSTWGARFNIQDALTNQWFNGVDTFSFVTEPTPWLANDDALGWRYPIGAPSVMFADGHTYRLKLVSRDNVGNEENPALKGMTNFLVDNTFPTANATTPGGLGFTEVDSVNLSGLAEDITPAGGLSQSSISAPTDVVFSIRQTDNFSNVTPLAADKYWDGANFISNADLLNDGGTSLICTA
ncbi:MAG: hypothetical protein AAB578_04875, partial [Elusimicrobiota bacterium]